ncbi:hypothetical protein LSH36_178g04026 [Paralvinella palmiformis]|uniref:Periphilin-1 C-terminal domain-containing protein n=1 Tax=Paralvinella palmiformis TaxID=53620 RepID=A0AAD9N5Q6_9ANNE|nr:hypothetical protein LSH36_178g04026 [Paralvinella palmiformis]
MFTEIRHDLYEEVSRVERITGSKEQRKIPVDHSEQMAGDYGQPPLERGGVITAERVRGPRDNGTHLVERGQPTSGGRLMPNHERSPMFDDHESAGSGQSIHKNSGPQSFNGGIMKEVEKGALGLPQDKMALIREKKDEIERSYRQDCETFAAVTKMLISKDTWLEDKLQASLKENLKDIGQRCIHELREFIEALKSESQR